MSEEEKEEMTDWLIAREECVEELSKEEILEKENKELREKVKELEETITEYQRMYCRAINDGISKQKIKDILNSKYRVFCEGDAEFPEFATKITTVKYIKAEVLEELLQESEDK